MRGFLLPLSRDRASNQEIRHFRQRGINGKSGLQFGIQRLLPKRNLPQSMQILGIELGPRQRFRFIGWVAIR